MNGYGKLKETTVEQTLTAPNELRCCVECFKDSHTLKRFMEPQAEVGRCSFCFLDQTHTHPVRTLPITVLAPDFGPMLEVFKKQQPGESKAYYMQPLRDLVQKKWSVFSDSLVAQERHGPLLSALLNEVATAPIDVYANYFDLTGYGVERSFSDIWHKFQKHIVGKERFLLTDDGRDIQDRLLAMLSRERLVRFSREINDVPLYRARRGDVLTNRDPWGGYRALFGPPPTYLSKEGRANAPGIPVLYCALEELTAIAEVRATIGEAVTIGTTETGGSLRLVDLTRSDYAGYWIPFQTTNLLEELTLADILWRIGAEMSQVVLAEDQHIDYVPTQFISELFRAYGYDGFLYRSRLNSGGTNVVIFDASKVCFVDAEVVSIDFITYEFSKYERHRHVKRFE